MKTHGFTFLFLILTTFSLLADWPQWRGPGRNGVVSGSPALANQWPKEGPKLLWRSVKIPSGNEGGYGSVVAMDGRVYASLVWQRMVPVESRTIDGNVLNRLTTAGFLNTAQLPSVTSRLQFATFHFIFSTIGAIDMRLAIQSC